MDSDPKQNAPPYIGPCLAIAAGSAAICYVVNPRSFGIPLILISGLLSFFATNVWYCWKAIGEGRGSVAKLLLNVILSLLFAALLIMLVSLAGSHGFMQMYL